MEQRTLKPGDRLDRYVILGEAGRGGMGEIYQARDPMLQRVVALKVLPYEYCTLREHRERFTREARAAAKIHHRNVVAVHDVGVREPPYIVMEYLTGETFDAFLKREAPVSLERALECLAPVMAAVIAAHECGVIHRDLKPANVMLAVERDGSVTPKVLDFGISKLTRHERDLGAPGAYEHHDNPDLTGADQQIGTPSYMAPEQDGEHDAVGPWSDAYSIALMLYLAVTGKKAFTGPGSIGVLVAKRIGRFTPPSEFPFGLPDGLDAWMQRALDPDVSARFADVRAMATALLAITPPALQSRWQPLFERERTPAPHVDLSAGIGASSAAPTRSGVETAHPITINDTSLAPVSASSRSHSPHVAAAVKHPTPRPSPSPPSRRERALLGAVVLLSAMLCVLMAREFHRPASAVAAPPPRVSRLGAPVQPRVNAPVPRAIEAPTRPLEASVRAVEPPRVTAPPSPPTTRVTPARRTTPRATRCGPDALYHEGACIPVPRLVLPSPRTTRRTS